MGEENEQKIWITTADPQNHWTNDLAKRVLMTPEESRFSYIPIENITSVDLVDAAENALQDMTLKDRTDWTCSFDISEGGSFTNADRIKIRRIFELPDCPLKKKKLNKKSFIKALMANGVPRNQAEGATWFFKRGKGIFSYPNSSDKNWQWLWR